MKHQHLKAFNSFGLNHQSSIALNTCDLKAVVKTSLTLIASWHPFPSFSPTEVVECSFTRHGVKVVNNIHVQLYTLMYSIQKQQKSLDKKHLTKSHLTFAFNVSAVIFQGSARGRGRGNSGRNRGIDFYFSSSKPAH